MIWAMAFALVVVGGVLFLRVPEKQAAPSADAPQATGTSAPVPVVALPVAGADLERVFGTGTPGRAGAEAARVGEASAEAVVCGLQTPTWLARSRDAWADVASGRYPSFEDNSLMTVALKSHLIAAFIAGQQQASNNIAARGKDAVCAALPTSPDYQAAMRTVSQAGQ
jgi:hypothetical protein